MPVQVILTRKGDTEPRSFHDIDRELCQALDIPFDEEEWAGNWYNTLCGWGLAFGASLDWLVDYWRKQAEDGNEPSILFWRIAAYLNEHYTTEAWRVFK